jgi:hypothetical protein
MPVQSNLGQILVNHTFVIRIEAILFMACRTAEDSRDITAWPHAEI